MAADRSPPYSVEAEQAVLGSMLLNGNAFAIVAGKIGAESFHRPDHRTIFSAIEALVDKHQSTDPVTVGAYLERTGQIREVGGLAYLGTLARDTPGSANVLTYAEIVQERANLRALAKIGAEIERSSRDTGERSASELIADAAEAICRLQGGTRTGAGLVSSSVLTGYLMDHLDSQSDGHRGLDTGLSDFDALSCGLEPGDLVVFAGRPGMGKTALLVTLAAFVAQTTGTAVFSAEMPALQLMRRIVALLSSVPQQRMRQAGRICDEDWRSIGRGASEAAQRRLWIDDTAQPALSHIHAECAALKARADLGMVLVDYVQLVRGHGANRYEQLRDVSYGLKALAKDLQVPVVVLAQLNRGVEQRDNKRPYLSDLRDSGAIEEAADIVALLYSEGYYDPGFPMPDVLECRIEKIRNGERGECLWNFAGEYSRITVLDSAARARYRQQQAKQRRGASNDL